MKKTVALKMRIRNNCRAFFVDAPEEAINTLELPEIDSAGTLEGTFDYIHLFVKEEKVLNEKFPLLKPHLSPGGMLWVSWPKGGQLRTDLNVRHVIRVGYNFGIVESTCLSINALWSALKFTHPKKGKVYKNSYGKLKR